MRNDELKLYFDQVNAFELLLGTSFKAPAANVPIPDFTEQSYLEIIENLSTDELWRIASSFLRRKEIEIADKYFELAYKKERSNSKVLAERGLIALLREDYASADKLLKRALTKTPDLVEARLWLTFVRIREGKIKGASSHLNKITETKSKLLNGLIKYLETYVAVSQDNQENVLKCLTEVKEFNDESFVRELLTYVGFLKGKAFLEKGDLVTASRIWSEAFMEDQEGWYKHPKIISFLSSAGLKRIHFIAIRKQENKNYHRILEKLLHLGLVPEFFEEAGSLEERSKFWNSKLDKKGSYPYAHFRYAICLLYQGSHLQAYEEFIVCRDKVPATKLSFFKLDVLIDWLRDYTDQEPAITTNIWGGFFSDPAESEAWISAGFDDPRIAKRWNTLGATPIEARTWLEQFKGEIPIAYSFYAVGFRDPIEAKKWSKHFSIPIEAWECYNSGIDINSRGKF